MPILSHEERKQLRDNAIAERMKQLEMAGDANMLRLLRLRDAAELAAIAYDDAFKEMFQKREKSRVKADEGFSSIRACNVGDTLLGRTTNWKRVR